MAITVQNVIDGGFAKSSAARPGTMASPAELVSRVGFCLLEVFQVISRENPYLIGVQEAVDFNGSGWPRPARCLRAIGLRATADTVADPSLTPGARIRIVPFDDQSFGAGKARVTELGGVFVPTDQSIDPSGGTLTLIHAQSPDIPTQTADTIDARFPEFLVDLLNYDMASFLAEKDERLTDKAGFDGMKSALLALLIGWTHGQTYELTQRFPIVTPPLTNTKGGAQAPLER